jgi:hypothetical protein
MMTDGAGSPQARHGNPLLVIAPQLLAVELLLLAFFIVLNSTSSFEAGRSRAVIDSLHLALGTSIFQDGSGRPSGEAEALAAVENRIASLAQAIGTARQQGPSRPDALWIDLPVDVFFRPGEDRVNPAQARFIESLTQLLARTPEGYRYEVAVVRGQAEAPAADGDLRPRQAGAIAAALQAKLGTGGALAAGLIADPAVGLRLDVSWSAPEASSAAPSMPAAEGAR